MGRSTLLRPCFFCHLRVWKKYDKVLKLKLKFMDFKKYLSFAWELAKIALIALVIVLPIRYFLFQPFIVKGESMAPNFENGDYLIVDEISYRFSGPQRGDVVVFNYPKDKTQRFIKRVIGLPGETMQVEDGNINIINGQELFQLNENYLPEDLKTYGDITLSLSADEYFVLGDNRDHSFDSRAWGVVPKKDIIGKAFLRIFPITSLSSISQPAY
jgi:signal peptidase I